MTMSSKADRNPRTAFSEEDGGLFDRPASPIAAGVDAEGLRHAIAFHQAHETSWPRSMMHADGRYVGTASIGDRPEHAAVIGPVRPRGEPNGIVIRHGRLAAEWGDTQRPDMTFSVSKSFLALLTGLACADGLIPDLDRPVGDTVPTPWFASAHNADVTWRQLLQLSSEWTGTLWGKPDSADHNRVAGNTKVNELKGVPRRLERPGTHFEYNDVRVNLLAACLTYVFRRPLPEILAERIMAPIGASSDWEWHGYDGAMVECGEGSVRAVAGGGHWGGGMFIGSRDLALVGQLVLRDGVWNDHRILPIGWVREMMNPSSLNAQYGLFWWLNGGEERRYPSAPADSVFALGAGTSLIWIAPSLDLIAVLRWIEGSEVDALLAAIVAAVKH